MKISLKIAVFILFLRVIIDGYGSHFCLIMLTFVLILTMGFKHNYYYRRHKIFTCRYVLLMIPVAYKP